MAMAAVFLVILLSTPAVFGAQYTIDWTLGPSYSSWATKPLNVGDTLVFNYDGTHTVDEVSESDFDGCDSSKALQSNTRSPTTITLKAGPTYIICGTRGHCAGGMKLQVNATSASGGSTPSTPTGGSSPSTPAASGSTPTAPSPSAASSLVSGGGLSLGLGLGALVAFFG